MIIFFDFPSEQISFHRLRNAGLGLAKQTALYPRLLTIEGRENGRLPPSLSLVKHLGIVRGRVTEQGRGNI